MTFNIEALAPERDIANEPLIARLRARHATVAVVGCGYVGLPLALTAAEAGFEVYGVDTDATKIVRSPGRASSPGAAFSASS